MGHASFQFNVLQKSKCKNSKPEPKLRRTHLSREMCSLDTRIRRGKYACIQAWPKRAPDARVSVKGAHASCSHLNYESHHAMDMNAPTGGAHASHAGNRPRCAHLT